MGTRLTDRDRRLISKCAICRWLSTSHIQRMYFPEASANAVQKRLRKLADEGYLRSRRENLTAEAVHAVGPKGKPLVEESGIEVTASSDAPKQLDHLLGINTIRIALETTNLPLSYFFAHWQLANLGWTFPAIPDAIFAYSVPDMQRILLEFDRGTEPLKVIVEKLRLYAAGIPDFAFQSVLLILENERRIEALRRDARAHRLPCLVGNLSDFAHSPLEPVLTNLNDGTRHSLLSSA